MPCPPADPPPIPVAWVPTPRPAPTSLPHPPPRRPLPQPRRPVAGTPVSACAQYFAATPTAAGWARRHAVDVLTRWQVSELTDDCCLVVSELVGNVVRHAANAPAMACRLVLKLFTDALLIEVFDPSPHGEIGRAH